MRGKSMKESLPERTGWTLLRRIVKAKRIESLFTSSSTGLLEENIKASSLWKYIINNQKKRPITIDVTTDTNVANLAPFPLPAPSSFETLTLYYHQKL